MVKPVKMTMQEILGMWLDVGRKLQKHPPDVGTDTHIATKSQEVVSVRTHIY